MDESGLLADSTHLFRPEVSRELYPCYIPLGPGRVVSRIRPVPPRLLAGRLGIPELHPSYVITPDGVHTDLPLIRIADVPSLNVHLEHDREEAFLAVLACEAIQWPKSLVAMLCGTMRDDVRNMGVGSARKYFYKSILWKRFLTADGPGSISFIILPSELLARVRTAPELLRVSQVSIPLTSASSSELPKLSPIPGFVPHRREPQLQNRRVLEESGYVVTMTSRVYHRPEPSAWGVHNCHASVAIVQLSRGAFSIQVRLTAQYFEIRGPGRSRRENTVQYSVTVAVGRNLTTDSNPYSDSPSSTERESQLYATFFPLQDCDPRSNSDVALQDVLVPFQGTSGPEVTLRILLSEHYPLRTYLLHLDVLDFEVARHDYYELFPESDGADTTAS